MMRWFIIISLVFAQASYGAENDHNSSCAYEISESVCLAFDPWFDDPIWDARDGLKSAVEFRFRDTRHGVEEGVWASSCFDRQLSKWLTNAGDVELSDTRLQAMKIAENILLGDELQTASEDNPFVWRSEQGHCNGLM